MVTNSGTVHYNVATPLWGNAGYNLYTPLVCLLPVLEKRSRIKSPILLFVYLLMALMADQHKVVQIVDLLMGHIISAAGAIVAESIDVGLLGSVDGFLSN